VGEELIRHRLLAPAKPRPHQDVLHTLKNAECSARSYVRQCQKYQKPSEHPFGTFVTPRVSVSEILHALFSFTPRE
jgi:hypothetical protein